MVNSRKTSSLNVLKAIEFFHKRGRRFFFLVPLIFVSILAALIYSCRSIFLVALVNNQPITRFSLDRELEKQAGQRVLDNIILRNLITQEAKKKGTSVSQQEIDSKVEEIDQQLKTQGQNLDQYLAGTGQAKEEIKEQIKIQILVEKILAPSISVSDEEIQSYFDNNKNYYPKETNLENKKDEIKQTLVQQKINDAFQTWVESLKNQAKIIYFLNF